MGEWLYYNVAAGSFHTKNFVADFIQLNLNYVQKNKKSPFEPLFEGLRGNVRLRTSPIARWKARGRLPIHHRPNGTFLLSLTVKTL